MDTANAVIAVLDELGKKFGIMIDWSQNNIQPYAQELMNRVVKYEIFTSIVWLVLFSVILLFIIIWAYKEFEDSSCISDKTTCFYLGFVFSIIPVIIILVQIFDIIRGLTIPELVFIEFIQRYLQ